MTTDNFTDAEVEAAAIMIARDVSYDADPDLSGYRIVARAALSAARAARRDEENPMTEDRLAMRLHLIRKETERAIRNGTKLDPRLIRDMSVGRRA